MNPACQCCEEATKCAARERRSVARNQREPAAAVAEAAPLVTPGGRLLIVDFAPHQLEHLRDEHQHRRLGFSDREMRDWLSAGGLEGSAPIALPPDTAGLTMSIWTAERPAAAASEVA